MGLRLRERPPGSCNICFARCARDGKSLEHVGVTPGELLLPSAADLAGNLDPVMAHAAELAGVHVSPANAAKIFPYEWPSD